MRRREFIAGLGGAASVAWSRTARAQQPTAKQRRIGHLAAGTEASRRPLWAAFRLGLQQLGYVEGSDFVIEARYAGAQFERLRSLADELLRLDVDVILASTTPASFAAKAATTTVPIVFVAVADPVGTGLIGSLSRPGGNITGITNIAAELTGKRLEILKELIPSARTVAIFINPDDPIAQVQLRNAEVAAANLNVALRPVLPIRRAAGLPAAFEAALASGAQAALRLVDPTESAMRKEMAALAAKFRLPVVYPFRESVEAGGLISYGPNLADQYRKAATLVHKIFKGEKPAEIPVEQPTKFEYVIHAKAAKELGITIPPTLLALADEVIE
jgi:putative ABC transport system substrate-binding protein